MELKWTWLHGPCEDLSQKTHIPGGCVRSMIMAKHGTCAMHKGLQQKTWESLARKHWLCFSFFARTRRLFRIWLSICHTRYIAAQSLCRTTTSAEAHGCEDIKNAGSQMTSGDSSVDGCEIYSVTISKAAASWNTQRCARSAGNESVKVMSDAGCAHSTDHPAGAKSRVASSSGMRTRAAIDHNTVINVQWNREATAKAIVETPAKATSSLALFSSRRAHCCTNGNADVAILSSLSKSAMARENQQQLDAEPKHAVPDHVSKRDTQSGKEHENPVSGLLPIEGNTRNDEARCSGTNFLRPC